MIENHNRYLYADSYFSNNGIEDVKETVFKRYSGDGAREKDSYYHTFMNWVPQPNEVMIGLWRHFETLPLPLNYNCIFEMEDPDSYIITDYTITQGLFNGWIPAGSLQAGHHYICILNFKDSIPELFIKFNKSDRWAQQHVGLKNNLGFCHSEYYPAICKARKEDILEREFKKFETPVTMPQEKNTFWKKITAYFNR